MSSQSTELEGGVETTDATVKALVVNTTESVLPETSTTTTAALKGLKNFVTAMDATNAALVDEDMEEEKAETPASTPTPAPAPAAAPAATEEKKEEGEEKHKEVTPTIDKFEPLLSPHSALVHEKEEGERLQSLLVRVNITGITSINERIIAILQLDAKERTDETNLEMDILLKVLDTYSKEHMRLSFEMAAPLLLTSGSPSKVSSHGKTEKTRPDVKGAIVGKRTLPLRFSKFTGSTFLNPKTSTPLVKDGKVMFSGIKKESILLSILMTLLACESFVAYLNNAPKSVKDKPLHKAIIIILNLIVKEKTSFTLKDTELEAVIPEDSTLPGNYISLMVEILYNEASNGKSMLLDIKIDHHEFDEKKKGNVNAVFGSFLKLFAIAELKDFKCTICDNELKDLLALSSILYLYCPEKNDRRMKSVSLHEELLLDSFGKNNNDRSIECLNNKNCGLSRHTEKSTMIIYHPEILIIQLDRQPSSGLGIQVDIREQIEVNGINKETYDLVAVIPIQNEVKVKEEMNDDKEQLQYPTLVKFNKSWYSVNVSDSSIQSIKFTSNNPVFVSTSLAVYVLRVDDDDDDDNDNDAADDDDDVVDDVATAATAARGETTATTKTTTTTRKTKLPSIQPKTVISSKTDTSTVAKPTSSMVGLSQKTVASVLSTQGQTGLNLPFPLQTQTPQSFGLVPPGLLTTFIPSLSLLTLNKPSLSKSTTTKIRPASSPISARNKEEADKNGKLLRLYKKQKGEEGIEKMKDDDE
jgi:hypothetical protein